MARSGNAPDGDEDSGAVWTKKSGTLMAWAVRASDRRATYIGSLGRDETGLRCGCVCAACGGTLQAVNAGKSADHYLKPNTLRPSFRHHNGQQQSECLVRVAQVIALKLLIDKGQVDLPAPSARATVVGASGAIYQDQVFGTPVRAGIRHRQWIDDHGARITLDDGRVVLVRLQGTHEVSSDGQLDAIVTITVHDPEVSTWTPEQIMDLAKLDGKWLCWDRHWDDQTLQTAAVERAQAQARDVLDLVPGGLNLPAGATPLQRSESVLHWVIKDILSRAAELRTPEFEEPVVHSMTDGRYFSGVARLPAMTLALSDVRVEFDLDEVVPDIYCRARCLNGDFDDVDLMIEVAVTHRVGPAKRQRIEQRGLACIEFDVGLLNRPGRMTVEELASLVCGDPRNKRWISHPVVAAQRASIGASLRAKAAALAQAEDAERLRNEHLQKLTDADLVRTFLRHLRVNWAGNQLARNVSETRRAEVVRELAKRGFQNLGDATLFGVGGVLQLLDAIRDAGMRPSSGGDALQSYRKVARAPAPVQRFMSVFLLAIRVYQTPDTAELKLNFNLECQSVKNSILSGELTFARPTDWDSMLSMLFPELARGLAKPGGTIQYARQVQAKLRVQEERQEAIRQALEAERLTAKFHQDRARELQEGVRETIARETARTGWTQTSGMPSDSDQAIALCRRTLPKYLLEPRINEVVASAWEARQTGKLLADWLLEQDPPHESAVLKLLKIVGSAWLVI